MYRRGWIGKKFSIVRAIETAYYERPVTRLVNAL